MIYSEAYSIAKKHFEKFGKDIDKIFESEHCWLFFPAYNEMELPSVNGIFIYKESGKIEPIILPDDKNFEIIDKAVEIN